MRQRRVWWMLGILVLVALVAWIAVSVVYPVPEIGIGMTEQQVETVLGQPEIRTHDVGHSGIGLYYAVARWLLGRRDLYIITYDDDGKVLHYDLIESDFGRSRRSHR